MLVPPLFMTRSICFLAMLFGALASCADAAAPKAKPVAAPPREITGQVYLHSRQGTALKQAAVTVQAYPIALLPLALEAIKAAAPSDPQRFQWWVNGAEPLAIWRKTLDALPPLATATTDAEGNYALKVPANEECFLFCAIVREMTRERGPHLWAVPVSAGRLDLTSANAYRVPIPQ